MITSGSRSSLLRVENSTALVDTSIAVDPEHLLDLGADRAMSSIALDLR